MYTGGSSNGTNGNCHADNAAWWQAGGGQSNGGGGGGGAGYYGGGGAGFIWTYCGGGGGGGSSWGDSSNTTLQMMAGVWQVQGNEASSQGAGRGGDRGYDSSAGTADASLGHGGDGRVEIGWG